MKSLRDRVPADTAVYGMLSALTAVLLICASRSVQKELFRREQDLYEMSVQLEMAGELLGSGQYLSLLYKAEWMGLLLLQIGNTVLYVRGRRKTAAVYYLLGISGFFQMAWIRQICGNAVLCFCVVCLLEPYRKAAFLEAVGLFYALTAIWGILCLWRAAAQVRKGFQKSRRTAGKGHS